MPLPYHAGKQQLSKPISKIIFQLADKNDKITRYAEPFCGMMRVGIEVMIENEKKKKFKKFLFSDVNQKITIFLKKLNQGWIPKVEDITQDKWERYKKNKSISAQKSFIGYTLGFGGQYFGGASPIKDKEYRLNYLTNKRKYLKKLKPHFTSNKFSIKNKSVLDLDFKNTLIYCDPPYIRTAWRAKTKWNRKDEDAFWNKVYQWLEPSKNNIVIISNSERTIKKKGLRIKVIFKKNHTSQGSWNRSGEDKIRSEMLFLVTRSNKTEKNRKLKSHRRNRTRRKN
jgi:site-specific DNA-adenine methylase